MAHELQVQPQFSVVMCVLDDHKTKVPTCSFSLSALQQSMIQLN